MRLVWSCGETGCLAADLQQTMDKEQTIALTTVLTTLDRLLKKKIVHRSKEGKAFRYFASLSEVELDQRIVSGVLDNLIARFPNAVATYFSQAADEGAHLTQLARRVEELQRQKVKKEKVGKESAKEETDGG